MAENGLAVHDEAFMSVDDDPAPPLVILNGGATRNCRNRLFEWMTTGMMLAIAVTLIVSPASITSAPFRYTPLDASVAFVLFLLAGTMRALALYLNGRWPIYGPRLRAVAAACGALIWFWMAWSIVVVYWPALTPAPAVYLFLIIGEIVSCRRAAQDGRTQ